MTQATMLIQDPICLEHALLVDDPQRPISSHRHKDDAMLKFFRSLMANRASDHMQENKENSRLHHEGIAHEIHLLVWGGFETPASIREIITEQTTAPNQLTAGDRRWITTEIQRRLADKRIHQQHWPRTTDWDRLDCAFHDLESDGIIALHSAGTTQSDGLSDTMEVFDARQQRGEVARGYVFYHGQDINTALESGRIHLAFGAFDNSEETAADVARQIVSTINRQGLHVSWEDSLDQRILIQPIEWRKRSPE